MRRKVTCLIFILILFEVPSLWASEFDGIWSVGNYGDYVSINSSDTTLIGIAYFPGVEQFFIIGQISGNQADINYSSNSASYRAFVTLTSPRTGSFIQDQCIPYPGDSCLFPNGISIAIYKVFP